MYKRIHRARLRKTFKIEPCVLRHVIDDLSVIVSDPFSDSLRSTKNKAKTYVGRNPDGIRVCLYLDWFCFFCFSAR